MRRFAVLSAVLLLVCGCLAQDDPTSVITRRIPVVGKYGGRLWPPVKSDKQGDVFVRLHDSDAPIDSSLLKISPDGLHTTKFLASAVPGAITTFLDFSPGPSGELYTLHECARMRGECDYRN